MKDLEVRFETGREVLNAYWGYLSDGGLIIPDQGHLVVGDPVALCVRIESSRATYSLCGRVVRCDAAAGRAVIAFSPGEPQDMLLTDALADAEHVPARRARRFRVRLEARVLDASSAIDPVEAQLVDLSEYGCCFRIDGEAQADLPVGTAVEIAAEEFAIGGRVVWMRHTERGVAFVAQDVASSSSALEGVREFLRRLAA
ncbi:MAG TPA: PilZ domain-containing protein [Kofleriaceae bacterium]|nr:PilZ domain-containing protein [Kofleriaceae bacterium]